MKFCFVQLNARKFVIFMLMLFSCIALISAINNPQVQSKQSINLLVFTKTKGFRHDSIPDAKRAVLEICEKEGFSVSFTENSEWFTAERLKQYDAVMFLLTTGDVLNEEQEKAFQDFILRGGGFVGVHAASDTEYDWEWYGKLVGAYFLSHPAIQDGVVHIEDHNHSTTKHLPNPWTRKDEWYDFKQNPRSKVHVLMTVDEKTYQGGKMGDDHPITWCHEFEGGRSWYTAMGHTKESYKEPEFQKMLTEAIKWVCEKRQSK